MTGLPIPSIDRVNGQRHDRRHHPLHFVPTVRTYASRRPSVGWNLVGSSFCAKNVVVLPNFRTRAALTRKVRPVTAGAASHSIPRYRGVDESGHYHPVRAPLNSTANHLPTKPEAPRPLRSTRIVGRNSAATPYLISPTAGTCSSA